MNEFWNENPSRRAAIMALAGFGFVALVGAGVWLAVYLSRYVPTAVGSIGSAAVSLSQIFSPAPQPFPPVASTTIPFGEATSTEATSTATSTAVLPTPARTTHPVTPQPGQESSGTYPLGGGSTQVVLSGLPDLQVTITAVGYLATTSADSFVASTTVPHNSRPAVRFTIKNIGTNKTGQWNFMALIPTQSSFIFQSQPQQSLNPGESIDYTLGFDQANPGPLQTITVSVNPDHTVQESNFDNNKATANITILGS